MLRSVLPPDSSRRLLDVDCIAPPRGSHLATHSPRSQTQGLFRTHVVGAADSLSHDREVVSGDSSHTMCWIGHTVVWACRIRVPCAASEWGIRHLATTHLRTRRDEQRPPQGSSMTIRVHSPKQTSAGTSPTASNKR